MANIPAPAPEDAIFRDEVYRLETTDPVLGHTGGNLNVANQQAKELIENDVFLKKKVDDLAAGTGLGDNSIERTKLNRGVLPAGVPRNSVITGPYTNGVRSILAASGTAMTFGAFRVAFAKGYDAKGQLDYFANVTAGTAQSAPSSPSIFYFYARMNESTGVVDVRHTTLPPVFRPTAPTSPANDQRWYDQSNEVMKVWDSGTSAWVETLSVFIGEARKLGDGTWTDVFSYEYRRDTNLESTIPAGTVAPFAGITAPSGWLLCDGAEVDINSHPRLFSVIGTTYGGDVGAGYFQTPDLRGRVAVGYDDMGDVNAGRVAAAWANVIGGAGGTETHTLSVNEIPAHGHPYRSGTASVSSASGNGGFVRDTNNATNYNAYTGSLSATAGQQIGATGGGQAHNNMQPGLTTNYIIKA